MSSEVKVELSHKYWVSNNYWYFFTISGFWQRYRLYCTKAFDGFEEILEIFINYFKGIGGKGKIWDFEN
jgi:hypothetical protein